MSIDKTKVFRLGDYGMELLIGANVFDLALTPISVRLAQGILTL
jgi:hypothetical protein